jgi:hypothetical protein
MRIEILDEAEKDLVDGFAFYEQQSKKLGDYFLDSIFSDVESLHLLLDCRRSPAWIRDRLR